MTSRRSARSSLLTLASAVGLLLAMAACSDDSSGGDGTGGAAGQGASGAGGSAGGGAGGGGSNPVQFIGVPSAQQVAWSAGQSLRIGVVGGAVRLGSATMAVQVESGGSALPAGCTDATKVCVVFTPINSDTTDNTAEAGRQMKPVADGGNLDTSAVNDGSGVQIQVKTSATNGAFSPSLSAQVYVVLPTGFDGDIVSVAATGDQLIGGVRNGLSVTGSGDVQAAVVAPVIPASGDKPRSITTDLGDITFIVPVAASLSVQGQTTSDLGQVTLAGAAGWEQLDGSTAQAATFCGNAACTGASDGVFTLKTTSGSILVQPR